MQTVSGWCLEALTEKRLYWKLQQEMVLCISCSHRLSAEAIRMLSLAQLVVKKQCCHPDVQKALQGPGGRRQVTAGVRVVLIARYSAAFSGDRALNLQEGRVGSRCDIHPGGCCLHSNKFRC